jgi:hypothetical protein
MIRLVRILIRKNELSRFPIFWPRLAPIAVCVWLMLVVSTSAQGPYSTTLPAKGLPAKGATLSKKESSSKPESPAEAKYTQKSLADSPTTPPLSANVKPLECGQIVARVDGQVVLSCDVLWQVNLILEQNGDRIPAEELENVRKMLLRQQVLGLIDTKLLFADFRRTVPAENMPVIEGNLEKPFEEHEIPRLMKMLEVEDQRELVELLEKYDTSLSQVKRLFIEKTIAGEWLRQRLPKSKPVTHEQMLEYYHQHLEEYEYPAQVQWEELAVKLDLFGGDRSQQRAQAWQAIAEMGNEVWWQAKQESNVRGAVFEEIAKSRSHGFSAKKGGYHDWTTVGSLRCQAIDKALFSLEVGQMSNIIESERGFHIVRVLQRKTAGRTPFTKAQAEIRENFLKQQRQGLVAKELAKIRENSRVWTRFDGYLGAERLSQVLQSRQTR